MVFVLQKSWIVLHNYWFRPLDLQIGLQIIDSDTWICKSICRSLCPGARPSKIGLLLVVSCGWPRKSICSLVEAGRQIFQEHQPTMDSEPAEYSSMWMPRPMPQTHGSRHAKCNSLFQSGDKAQKHIPLPYVCLFGINNSGKNTAKLNQYWRGPQKQPAAKNKQ